MSKYDEIVFFLVNYPFNHIKLCSTTHFEAVSLKSKHKTCPDWKKTSWQKDWMP